MRVSPRAKPTAAAAAEKEPTRASHRGHAMPEAPKTQAAAPSKAAATKPAAAKAAPAKKTPAKAAPTKAAPTKATKATPAAKPEPVKAAPAKAAPARGRQAQGGKQLRKKASGVAPKPRKMRRNENYKVRQRQHLLPFWGSPVTLWCNSHAMTQAACASTEADTVMCELLCLEWVRQ